MFELGPRQTLASPGVCYCRFFLPEADIRGWSVHVFNREGTVLPYFNTYLTKLKGFSLAYLHVIHFETSQFNTNIFARVLFLFFISFSVHLENYPEYISRTNGLNERALGKTRVTSIFWVISGDQCKNSTFSNPLFSEGLNVTSLYESWIMFARPTTMKAIQDVAGCHVEPMYKSSSTR